MLSNALTRINLRQANPVGMLVVARMAVVDLKLGVRRDWS